MNQLASKFFG